MKILVVDDKLENRYYLEALLKGNGHTVCLASNGEEALAQLQSEAFDLIISDVLMPVMDGFKLCQQVKTDEQLRHIPFIFFTATYTNDKDKELALKIGADRYIVKPCEPDDFMEIVNEVMAAANCGIIAQRPEHLQEDEVLKLYSERLVNKLEQKMLQLEAETRALREAKETQKELEAKLYQAQKMESIGTLAGGIAHDFNNILSAITGYTDLALIHLDDNPKIKRYLEKVHQASFRARDLVHQILSFSRISDQGLKPMSVTYVVKEVMKLLRSTIPATIQIYEHWESENDQICGNATQIHQVLMNLCTNASYAMKGKEGKLEVILSDENLSAPTTVGHFTLNPGTYLKLTVRDSGHGIPAEDMQRIFDPYFTTKPRGEGTGLGLSIIYGIIKDHNGGVGVTSTVGKGTTFEIFLPVSEKTASRAEISTPILQGSGNILLVDDEESLVEAYGELLTSLGYTVDGATSSRQALELFKENPEKFDLVFTDHTMAHMTGFQLAEKLLEIRPKLPVILYSGFAEDITPKIAKAHGIRHLLAKPLIKNEVARILHNLLGQVP